MMSEINVYKASPFLDSTQFIYMSIKFTETEYQKKKLKWQLVILM